MPGLRLHSHPRGRQSLGSSLKLLEVPGLLVPTKISSDEQVIWGRKSSFGAAEDLPSFSLLPAGTEAGWKFLLPML